MLLQKLSRGTNLITLKEFVLNYCNAIIGIWYALGGNQFFFFSRSFVNKNSRKILVDFRCSKTTIATT